MNETGMTDHANSPKAREYERQAATTRARITDDMDPAVRDYLERSAKHWERRAAEIQAKADRRKYLRDHPEVMERRRAASAEIAALERRLREARRTR